MQHTNYGVVKPIGCPYCGMVLDDATLATGPNEIPSPGDISICFGCGGALEYDSGLRLQVISHETLETMEALEPWLKEQFEDAKTAIRQYRGKD